MKTLRLALTFAIYASLGWLSIGCGHAQVKPTAYVVDLSWTAPAASGSWGGCTTASPCSYIVSRITLSAGTTTCPAANTTTPNYTPLNQSSPVAGGVAYADTAAAGLTVCYIAQTQQGTAVSQPSNLAGPFVVPASPIAPAVTGSTTTASVKDMPKPTASEGAPVLSAKLTPVYGR